MLWKKADRLLKPMFFTAVLYYLPIMKVVNHFYIMEPYNQPMYRLIFGFCAGINLDQLWFVYALFIMYVIAFPIIRYTRILENAKGRVLSLLFTYIVNLGSYVGLPSCFCLSNIARYSIFFGGGTYIVCV